MTVYIPTMKSKRGEYRALAALDPVTRGRCLPLIELLPKRGQRPKADRPAKPPPTIDEQIAEHVRDIGQASCERHRVTIDFTHLPATKTADGRPPATVLMDQLHHRSVKASPVIWGSSPLSLVKALKGPWCTVNGATLRMTPVDLDSGFDTIEVLLSFLGVSPGAVDLIFDCGSIEDASSVRVGAVNAALRALATKPWRTMSFSAASFPVSLTELGDGEFVFPRHEWAVWQAIDEDLVGRHIGFSDYGIRNVNKPTEGGTSPVPNQRYTLDDQWLVLRAKAKESYLWRDLAIELVNDRRFMQSSHCAGCRRYDDFALGTGTGGNAEFAIQYGMIHHLTVVGQQLASSDADRAAS